MVWRKPAINFQDFGEHVLFLYLLDPSKVGLVAAFNAMPPVVLDADIIRREELALEITAGKRYARNTQRNHAGAGISDGRAFALAVIVIVLVVAGCRARHE